MEWLVFAALGVALYKLYERVQRLEARITELAVEPLAEPPEPVRTVPKVRIIRTEVSAPEPEPEAEPEPEPAREPEPEPVVDETPARAEEEQREPSFATVPRKFDFEDLFGRRLPIWAGGVALALAGIFLVRFSIEAGLLTPPVRVALSFVFGLALLAGAEAAYRFETRVRDPRVRQALAGAGLATLYAGFYLAGTVYGLIGSAGAFVGLAAVTAAAIGLSWRFGLPSAVLGLVGGFAAPALVASDDANIPLLTLYLALVAGGLSWTGARQGRAWLGYLALAGGFGWGGLLLAGGLAEGGDLVALGLLIAVLGVGIPLLLAGDPHRRVTRLVAAVVSSL